MTASLWVTLIIGVATPVCTLIGVIVVNKKSNKQQSADNKAQNQATKDEIKDEIKGYKDLTIYRIEQLEAKQDKHNNHTERLYNLEGKVKELANEMATVRDHLLNTKK